MKRKFYLQHQLMAAADPRMKRLLAEEGMKGYGVYWYIVEKLSLMPDVGMPLDELKPFCQHVGLRFAYAKKIILNYGLFTIGSDDYVLQNELNSGVTLHENERKTSKCVNFEQEKTQKISKLATIYNNINKITSSTTIGAAVDDDDETADDETVLAIETIDVEVESATNAQLEETPQEERRMETPKQEEWAKLPDCHKEQPYERRSNIGLLFVCDASPPPLPHVGWKIPAYNNFEPSG